MRLAKPDGPARGSVAANEPEPAQAPVDHAELRVVHPLPGQHADRDGQRERDDDETSDQLLALEVLEQKEGQARAQHALEDGRDNQEHDAVAERDPEGVHLPGGPEVLEANEPRHRFAHIGVADGQVQREQEGHADQEQDIEGRGRQQHVAEGEPTRGRVGKPSAGAGSLPQRNGGGPGAGRVRTAAGQTCRHARLCLAKIRRYSPTPQFREASTDSPRATRVKMSGNTKRLATSWICGVYGPGYPKNPTIFGKSWRTCSFGSDPITGIGFLAMSLRKGML